MYELVSTVEQEVIFNSIWEEAWKEKGYELEYSKDTIAQFMLKSNGQYAATIEFKQLVKSDICDSFDFKAFPHIAKEFHNTVEIDKISIVKEQRGLDVLKVVIASLAHFAEEHSIPYYVALIEPRFYLTLRRHFKVNVRKLGPSFRYKGDDVIPISIDMPYYLKNQKQVDLLDNKTAVI